MQAIRQTQQLNKRELENATPPSASWHADYRDTAWVYVGGLPFDLTEGDVVIILSQFGNPTHLNLVRDKETGKSKGFGFLKYEDQRSCDLAVDNLTGAEVLGKLLRVDHTRYKKRDDEDDDTYRIDRLEAEQAAERNGKRASDSEESDEERQRRKRRKARLEGTKKLAIKEHGETTAALRTHDDEDSDEARARERHRERKHKHRHRPSNSEEEEEDKSRKRYGPDVARNERRNDAKGSDRDGQERKQYRERRSRDESRNRDGTPRGGPDGEESGHRPRSKRDSSHNRDYEEPRRRRKRSTSASRERKPQKTLDSGGEDHSHPTSRNGKTRRTEHSRE